MRRRLYHRSYRNEDIAQDDQQFMIEVDEGEHDPGHGQDVEDIVQEDQQIVPGQQQPAPDQQIVPDPAPWTAQRIMLLMLSTTFFKPVYLRLNQERLQASHPWRDKNSIGMYIRPAISSE